MLGSELTSQFFAFLLTHSNSFDVAPRRDVQPLFDTLYPQSARSHSEQHERIRLHPQELALLFIIFAMGARHALEWEQGEGPDEEYSQLARTCLSKGDFMTHHTICGVQTLVSPSSHRMEAEHNSDY
jgi:hypothetical protein